MRGLAVILAYILGNESARKWCIKNICQASCIIDKEMKKTSLYKKCLEMVEKNKSNLSDKDIKND